MECPNCQKDVIPEFEKCCWCNFILYPASGTDEQGDWYIDQQTGEKFYS